MANLDCRGYFGIGGFDGLVLFEFFPGVSREFGVASALWGRSRGSRRKSETHSRFCTGIFVVGQFQGVKQKDSDVQSFLFRGLRYGAVSGGLAEKTKTHGRFCSSVCVAAQFQEV